MMKIAAMIFLLASFQILAVHEVEARCASVGYVGNSDWFSCFKKKQGDNCPHNFIKIEKPTSGNTYYCDGSAEKVCCMIVPKIVIEVKDTPCLDEPCKKSTSEKRKAKKIAQQSIPRVLSPYWRK